MKRLFFLCLFALVCSQKSFGQDVAFKKDVMTVDGKECLKVDSHDANHVSFMDLAGNELFFLKFVHNSRYGLLYTKITFLSQKLTFTCMSYGFTKKLLVKKLLADGTLRDCALVPAKVESFVLKYDENIEGR